MKTKHILLLGLGSLTATAAIATPIALVNYDFGGGGKQTRIVVGNVNSDSATLEIPFSEKISSTKATVTLVYENKEEQVEAKIVNENDVTKVILTNLKPNTNYQIKQMEIDDKIINFKDSQFATKDNTLEQDVVVKPNDSQLPKTVQKTDENKEESKKNEEKQEDKQEQGQSTKVEEPVVTPGVGAQEPAVSLPQKAESKEADNSAEKQKEEEKPKDQPDNSGPSSNTSTQNEVTQPEPEVKKEPPVTEAEAEKQEVLEESNRESTVISNENSSSSVSTEVQTQPQKNTEQQSQASSNEDSQQSNQLQSNADNESDHNSISNSGNQAQSITETEAQQGTPSQSGENGTNTEHQTSNPSQTTSNIESQAQTNQETDKHTTIRVGYWRVDNYSTKRKNRTELFAKVIKEEKLALIAVSDISVGKDNNGQKIVDKLNQESNSSNWKQLTSELEPKSKKRKISFIYDSSLVTLTPDNERIQASASEDPSYIIQPVLLTFKTNDNKVFSLVSSIFNSTKSRKSGGSNKGENEQEATPPTNDNQDQDEVAKVQKLENDISQLISDKSNVIFMGSTNISNKNESKAFESISSKYTSLTKQATGLDGKGSSKNDVAIFAKQGSDFTIENPVRFQLKDFMAKNHLEDHISKHAPVYVDLKFN